MFQFVVAEGCGTVATFCDIGAAICYHMSGNQLKRNFALFGVGLDLIPGVACYFKPELKTGYNIAAKRFINLVSGRFVTNTTGYTYYFLSPSTGILYSISSNLYINNVEE